VTACSNISSPASASSYDAILADRNAFSGFNKISIFSIFLQKCFIFPGKANRLAPSA